MDGPKQKERDGTPQSPFLSISSHIGTSIGCMGVKGPLLVMAVSARVLPRLGPQEPRSAWRWLLGAFARLRLDLLSGPLFLLEVHPLDTEDG